MSCYRLTNLIRPHLLQRVNCVHPSSSDRNIFTCGILNVSEQGASQQSKPQENVADSKSSVNYRSTSPMDSQETSTVGDDGHSEAGHKISPNHFLPYPKLSKEERHYLTIGHLTQNLQVKLNDAPVKEVEDVDPDSHPFSHIYQGVEDKGWFTRTENVLDKDPDRWLWVERLLTKKQISNYPLLTKLKKSEIDSKDNQLPSGYQLINEKIPDLPYFIGRMRTGLYPVYKKTGHTQKTVTVIRNIEGDIWLCRDQLMSFISKVKQLGTEEQMVSVNEVRGSLTIYGDHVMEAVDFLTVTGF